MNPRQPLPTRQSPELAVWLRRATRLPPVPAVAEKALALLDDADSRVTDVARLIAQDEAMTAKVLHLVNSAFFGLAKPVSTLSRAVVFLGYEQVRLVVVSAAFEMLGLDSSPAATTAREKVWRHATSCAGWAQALARRTSYPSPEEAFIAGLLHDVGKVLLAVSEPEAFEATLAAIRESHVDSVTAEREVMGVDHVMIGEMLAQRWRFPRSLSTCITLHHVPWSPRLVDDLAGDLRLEHLLAIVRVANAASHGQNESTHAYTSDSPGSAGRLESEVLESSTDLIANLVRLRGTGA